MPATETVVGPRLHDYFTDGKRLLFVIEVSDEGVMVEDVVSEREFWVSYERLVRWRLVEPEEGG